MKNYTITVNGNVYEVTVEEGFTGAASAPKAAAPAPKAAPAAAPKARRFNSFIRSLAQQAQ